MISAIVATDEQGLIGRDGVMPWHLPQELAWFQEVTMGHTLLMGKTTYMHLPGPLNNRTILVASHHDLTLHPHDERCTDMVELLRSYEHSEAELIVCGGASIYLQAMPYITRWWISIIPGTFQGDTYLPPLSNTFQFIHTIPKAGFCVYMYQRKQKEES